MSNCMVESARSISHLDRLMVDFQDKFGKRNPTLTDDVRKVTSVCVQVLKECPRFEYFDVPASGLRSVVTKWTQLVEYSLTKNVKTDQSISELESIVRQAKRILPFVPVHLSETLDEKVAITDKNTRRCLNLIRLVSIEEDNIETIFTPVALRFDHKFVGNFLVNMSQYFTSYVVSDGPLDIIRAFCCHSFRIKMVKDYYRWCPREKLFELLSYSLVCWYTWFYPTLAFGSMTDVSEVISVPRQTRWSLKIDHKNRDLEVSYETSFPTKSNDGLKTINCFINRRIPRTASEVASYNAMGAKVLIYVHGGGFVTNSMKGVNNFLPKFAKRCPGLTIIAVDISLANKSTGKFPVPVNEVLDVIIWLGSGCPSVKRLLKLEEGDEDEPLNYIISGDSSGAFILLEVIATINEINRRVLKAKGKLARTISDDGKRVHFEGLPGESTILLPTKIIGLSPVFTFCPSILPSMILSVKDVILFPSILGHMAFAYLPDVLDDDGKVIISTEKWNQNGSFFLKPVDESLKDVHEYYWLLGHKLFNPYNYDHWDDIKDIPLHMIASTDDPILDMGLAFLPKWKGHVTLDVVPVLKHGFFYFHSLSHTFFRCVKERMIQAEDILIKRIMEDVNHNRQPDKEVSLCKQTIPEEE